LTVNDGELSDLKQTNITVIEINNPPNLANIGAKTVWTQGENSTFIHQIVISDQEDGTNPSNFILNLTFLSGTPLFNISSTGIMNFTPNESHVGVYSLRVYATDNGIQNMHPNISVCGPGAGDPKTTFRDFSLTVTDENRPPVITNHYPENLTFEAQGNSALYFNITKHDPDGTIPDSYWFVDGELVQYIFGNSSVDEFEHFFPCETSGLKTVKAEITDGELNASAQWNITFQANCPPSGPSGGGGGPPICQPIWGCEEWGICRSLSSFPEEEMSFDEFIRIKSECLSGKIPENLCGFQERECHDLSECGIQFSLSKPSTVQACYFVSEPSCFDRVRNCHSGSCEVLVDCGGPCAPCPTCSDGIQNQGEEGVDCGGPCPWACEDETPLKILTFSRLMMIFILALIAVLILVVTKIYIDRRRLRLYGKER
jgi:hypothetical protein